MSTELSPSPRAALDDAARGMLDLILDGVAVHDADGRLVYANAPAAALCGFPSASALVSADPSEIVARLEVVDESGRALAITDVFGIRDQAQRTDRLVRLRSRDGTPERWARVLGQPMPGPSGARWTVTTLRDLTDRVTAAERAQREAERERAQLAAILDSISDPFTVLDQDMRIVHANTAAARGLDKLPQELVGASMWDLAPEVRDPAFKRAYEQVLASHEPVQLEEYYPARERWFETSIYPLTGGLSVYSRDVTMRRRALDLTTRLARHNLLRADVVTALSEETAIPAMLGRACEAIVDHLEAAFARVWTADEPGTTLILQASAGMYTHLDGPHKAVPVRQLKIGRIAASKEPHLTHDVLHDPQIGNPAWAKETGMVAFAGYPMVVDDKLVGVMAMFSRTPLPDDTTSALAGIADTIAQGIERRRAEDELAQRVVDLGRSNAELEQFAYVASHDLQEPLRMISSYNQLLARRYKGKLGEDADEFIAFTVEGVTRMQRLINDLLAYSRVGTRGGPTTEIPLDAILAETRANLAQALEESGAELVIPQPLPRILGDRSQIGQLMQNLVGNAIKFRGTDPPRIEITAQRAGAWWKLAVKDNGIGIESQYFERIFVIFQRLNSREDYPGTGIGLALCKKIVERHGGKISVKSAPGAGTTMLFTLPAVQGART